MSRAEWDEERLLQLLVDGASAAEIEDWARRAGLAPPAAAARAAELDAFLETCRRAFAPDASAAAPDRIDRHGRPDKAHRPDRAHRTERLVQRVLARTTREDLSWRGDLRLVSTFLRERLRSSRALRLAAASLIVHLLALPAIAWYVLGAPWKEGPQIVFELPAPLPELGEEPDEEPPLEAPPDAFAEGEVGSDAFAVENALRRARFLLERGDVPPLAPRPAGATAPALEIRLLRARSAGVHAGEWDEILVDEPRARSVDGLARVLFAEALLDRYALADPERRDPGLLPVLLANLGAERELSPLEVELLARAASYGLAAPPLPRPGRTGRPVDRAWLEQLRRALEARGLAGPEVDAWVGWSPPETGSR